VGGFRTIRASGETLRKEGILDELTVSEGRLCIGIVRGEAGGGVSAILQIHEKALREIYGRGPHKDLVGNLIKVVPLTKQCRHTLYVKQSPLLRTKVPGQPSIGAKGQNRR